MNTRFYNILVLGDNPEQIIEKYNTNKEVEPYIKYQLTDLEKIYNNRVLLYDSIIKEDNIIDVELLGLAQLALRKLKKLTPIEYYRDLSLHYELDGETGDLLSSENPLGRYKTISREDLLLVGDEWVSQAKNKDIDWDKLHLNENRYNLHRRAYQLCVEGFDVQTDVDRQILDNMSGLGGQNYWDRFDNSAEYASYCESFGTYAIVSEKLGWLEMPVTENEIKWKIEFHERFVKKIRKNELLTTYMITK